MLAALVPDLCVSSVQDVPLDRLKQDGIQGLLVDLDNTLVPWHDTRPLPAEMVAWFSAVKARGLKAVVLSNGLPARVEETMQGVDIPCVSAAGKPWRSAFEEGLRRLELQPHRVAMIGDQLFTDVLGAKRAGLYTILVPPLSRREFVATRLRRPLERWLLRRFRQRDMLS